MEIKWQAVTVFKSRKASRCFSHCTKMYLMTLMCLSLLSGFQFSSFPQVFESSGAPPVPNPILESHEEQFHSLLLIIPIRALEAIPWSSSALNPSWLHLVCKEAWEPRSVFKFYVPVKSGGIVRQQSASKEIQPAFWWPRSWVVGKFSYRDRSRQRECSSRWAIWFPVRQIQFSRQESCILHNHSSENCHSERLTEIDRTKYLFNSSVTFLH